MTFWSALTALVALVFLGATVLAQLPSSRWGDWLKSWDVMAIIPSWSFFAPNPGTSDARILFRDQYADGTESPWHEVEPPKTGLLRALWQPEKRLRKGLSDCASIVQRQIAKNPESAAARLSLPYLLLVSHVGHSAPSPLSVARQIAVLSSNEPTNAGENEGLALDFLSYWFRLPGVPLELPLPAPGIPKPRETPAISP